MAVYVDNRAIPFGSMIMCHMVADTTKELLAMADTIGVHRKWIQGKGTHREHFDICISKKKLAIRAGAKQLTGRELMRLLIERKKVES